MSDASGTPLAFIHCGQLVTVAGPARPRIRGELRELAIIPDGAFTIRAGRIEQVDSTSALFPQLGSEYDVVDVGGRVVLPGFVDAHAHPVFAGTRLDEYELRARGATYEEIAANGGGIRSTVRKTRAASEDELFELARRRSKWFLRTGATTVEAKSGYGLSVEDECKMLRVVRRLNENQPLKFVPTFLGAHEIPDEYEGRMEDYANLVIDRMLPRIRAERLAEYCDIFCEPSVFPVEAARRILAAARDLGYGIRVHADQLTSSGAAQLAAELNATTADHLEQIEESGIAALARAGVQPVLLPSSVYCLGRQRYAPARAMIDAGLAVVLATDFNPGSSPNPSIPFVLSLASTHMKMLPAEGIVATTINAAYSLGRGQEAGSIEPGKRADFVIHDCHDYREIAYFVGIESAQAVYVDGRLAFEKNGHA